MPRAYVDGCAREALCLEHFLLYLGFEVAREGDKYDVAVHTGTCAPCRTARVTVYSREAALACGGLPARLASELGGPVRVRVDKSTNTLVYTGAYSLYLVMRELERLLGWAGLLWRQPPEKPYLDEARKIVGREGLG